MGVSEKGLVGKGNLLSALAFVDVSLAPQHFLGGGRIMMVAGLLVCFFF